MAATIAVAMPALAADGSWREAQQPPLSSSPNWTAAGTALPLFAELPTDLWDRPLLVKRMAQAIVFYSMGPNGLDDDGRGDDLTPTSLDDYYRRPKIRLF